MQSEPASQAEAKFSDPNHENLRRNETLTVQVQKIVDQRVPAPLRTSLPSCNAQRAYASLPLHPVNDAAANGVFRYSRITASTGISIG